MEIRVENLTRSGIILFNFEAFGNVVKKRHDVHSSFFTLFVL